MYIKKAFALLISQTHNDANFHQMLSNGIQYLKIYWHGRRRYNYIYRDNGYNLISSLFPGWFCGRREHRGAKIE